MLCIIEVSKSPQKVRKNMSEKDNAGVAVDNTAEGFLLWWNKCLSCGAEIKNGMDKDGSAYICKEASE